MSILYLSEDDMKDLDLSPSALADAISHAFLHRRQALLPPKSAIRMPQTGAYFHAMPAAIQDRIAGVKWIAGSPANAGRGLAHVMGLLILSDVESGKPLALLEAGGLTGWRTAAVSLLAARHLARRDSATVAFIGCGLQARTHLAALGAEFPIRKVRAFGRSREGAAHFCRLAEDSGYEALACADAREALAQSDMIVSTVPASRELEPFLEAQWLEPGAFAAMVDLGRSWREPGMAAFDRIFTDDIEQTLALKEHTPLFGRLAFSGDLAALVADECPGRTAATERIAFVFPGAAIADLAAGELALKRARALGIGTILPA